MFGQFTLTFHWYGLIVGLAVSLVWWLVTELSQKQSLPTNLTNRWWLVMLGSLAGARMWHLLTDWPVYSLALANGEWWRILAIWQGGLSILGAVLAALILIRWWWGKFWVKAVDILVLALPFGQVVGRLANWVNQELYGLPTNLPWGIKIDSLHRISTLANLDSNTKFHPLFAYEAIGLLFLAILLWQLKAKFNTWAPGNARLAMLYLTGYSWLRFGLDFLRPNPGPVWQGLGFNQWVLLLVGVVGMFFWLSQFRWFQTKLEGVRKTHQLSYLWPVLVLAGLLIWLFQISFSYQSQSRHQASLNTVLAQTADGSEISVTWNRQQVWGEKIVVEVPLKLTLAKTINSRAIGLGGIDRLSNDGMLFWFDQPAKWQFWMKNMNFGLDFLWLKNGEIVQISSQVQPPSPNENQDFLPLLIPKQLVNQVVELHSGRADDLGLKVGDKIIVQN